MADHPADPRQDRSAGRPATRARIRDRAVDRDRADRTVDQADRLEKERDALQGQLDALSAKLAVARTELVWRLNSPKRHRGW
jgi:hypothetical protein